MILQFRAVREKIRSDMKDKYYHISLLSISETVWDLESDSKQRFLSTLA